MDDTRRHWTESAVEHGAALGATTKTWTAKVLELDALARRFQAVLGGTDSPGAALEMGCGNGVNCLELATAFRNLRFDGVDYVPEMITSAEENRTSSPAADRVRFFVGDAVGVGAIEELEPAYDIVFTDRCLINLKTVDLQKQAISALAAKVRPGGHLLMIENSMGAYGRQNHYRELLGLPPRTPAAFNLFFDEDEILAHVRGSDLELVDVEDFISLHDLALYVLVPAINGGEVDYGHPLVEAAAMLNKAVSAETPGAFGAAGQNRLYCCRKRP
jgi:SAM-dependent methyltransferase